MFLFTQQKLICREDYNIIIKRLYNYNNIYAEQNKTQDNMYRVCDILSGIMPQIYFKKSVTDVNNVKKEIEIINGIFTENKTFMNKKIINSTGGLIHIIFNDCGPESAKTFIDNISVLGIEWLLIKGFTTTIGDCYIKEDKVENNKQIINNCLNKSYQ